MTWQLLDISKVVRREQNYLTAASAVKMRVRVVIRRDKPSVPQFSGTLSPARVQRVSLQLKDGDILETAVSDVGGYFEFTGWYPTGSDYEFFVHGDDLYEAKIFSVSTPVEHRWNGRPDIVDSTDLS